MTRLNLDNLSGLLAREKLLSAFPPPATAAAESTFDEHLFRAQNTAEQTTTEGFAGHDAGQPSPADGGSTELRPAVPAPDGAGQEAQTSDRRDDPDTAGRAGGTAPDPAASSGNSDNSSHSAPAADADRGKRDGQRDHDTDPDAAAAAGAGAAAPAKPASDATHDPQGEASEKVQKDPSHHASGKLKADGVALGEQTPIETRGHAEVGAKAPVAGRGKKEDQDPAKESPVAGSEPATQNLPQTANATQGDAPGPKDGSGGATAQGAEVQAAQAAVQSPGSALATAPPGESKGAVQVSASQPADSAAAPSRHAAARAGAKALNESRPATADAGDPPVGGKLDAAQEISLASAPPPGADATNPASASPTREAGSTKPAETPLSVHDAASVKPAGQTARAPDAGGPAPGSEQADRVRFVQRVARAFDAAADRGGTVRLRLDPPELGSLRLELTVRNGKMNARLEAETQSARNLILDSLPALRQRLAEHQIQVERFDVDWGGQPSGSLPQQSQDQPGRNPGQAGAGVVSRNDSNGGAATPSGAPTLHRTGYGGRLDVVI